MGNHILKTVLNWRKSDSLPKINYTNELSKPASFPIKNKFLLHKITYYALLARLLHSFGCRTLLIGIIKQYIMNTGKVKFFNETKGFGFITEDDSNTEHFVHVSGLIDEIKDEDSVEFELQEGRKGLNAVNVKVVQ